MKWVTRERPKVDRVACSWLIRRFVDAEAELLFVPPDQVLATAEREGASPFDAPDVELEVTRIRRPREDLLPPEDRLDPRHQLASSSYCQTSPQSFWPPSMYHVSPVTKSNCSLASTRIRRATSSGVPARRSGQAFAARATISSGY